MKEIEERRSIRKYTEDHVRREDLDAILKAGMLAPSAKNRQPWKYYVYGGEKKNDVLNAMEKGLIREWETEPVLPESRDGLPDAFYTLKIMREAPILIMVENPFGSSPFLPINTDDRVSEICDTLSIGASVENILLTAAELGYGTLWIANTCFAYPELVDAVGIQGQLVCAISLGVAKEHPKPRPRKAPEDVIVYR